MVQLLFSCWVVLCWLVGFVFSEDSETSDSDYPTIVLNTQTVVECTNRDSGTYFEFVGDEVYINIQPTEGDPSIRINSIPANGKSEITNGPWIGSSGKQVRFRKNIPYIDV